MWDLIVECERDGRPAIAIVEAKAHEGELDWGRKPLAMTASEQSQRNHDRIVASLRATQMWFREKVDPDARISAESHYQLANRLATAHVLAECGYHAVLVYLGFTGDTYFRDYLRDSDHWQRAIGAYLRNVVPLHWPGTVTHHESGGSLTMLIAALPVTEVSI
jgi:hypothetical protein